MTLSNALPQVGGRAPLEDYRIRRIHPLVGGDRYWLCDSATGADIAGGAAGLTLDEIAAEVGRRV